MTSAPCEMTPRLDTTNLHVKISPEIKVIPRYQLRDDQLTEERVRHSLWKKRLDFLQILPHQPRDEVDMLSHGFVDKHARRFSTPQATADTPAAQEALQGVVGQNRQQLSQSMGLSHLPFDDVALKHSGYVDEECRRITDRELNEKKAAAPGQGHVLVFLPIDPNDSSASSQLSGPLWLHEESEKSLRTSPISEKSEKMCDLPQSKDEEKIILVRRRQLPENSKRPTEADGFRSNENGRRRAEGAAQPAGPRTLKLENLTDGKSEARRAVNLSSMKVGSSVKIKFRGSFQWSRFNQRFV